MMRWYSKAPSCWLRRYLDISSLGIFRAFRIRSTTIPTNLVSILTEEALPYSPMGLLEQTGSAQQEARCTSRYFIFSRNPFSHNRSIGIYIYIYIMVCIHTNPSTASVDQHTKRRRPGRGWKIDCSSLLECMRGSNYFRTWQATRR